MRTLKGPGFRAHIGADARIYYMFRECSVQRYLLLVYSDTEQESSSCVHIWLTESWKGQIYTGHAGFLFCSRALSLSCPILSAADYLGRSNTRSSSSGRYMLAKHTKETYIRFCAHRGLMVLEDMYVKRVCQPHGDAVA